MTTTLSWQEIALRLALAVLAGALFGIDRSARGRAAGLRTTLLVCLAAAVAMIQANLLLRTSGKPSDSFVVADIMRLPLGILSGMGFIGAGVIVRRGDIVLGVTTAATLWFVTVVGLCFGGGQIAVGLAASAIGLIVLWCLKWAENRLARDRHATLIVKARIDGPTEGEIRGCLTGGGFWIASSAIAYTPSVQTRELKCEVGWRGGPGESRPPAFLAVLSQHPGILELQWREGRA